MNQSTINPKSIAIVGVSENNKKVGSVILNNLLKDGYTGDVYPINPKYDEISGLKCYKSVKDIEQSIDMVCIAIPAHLVEQVVDECIEKGVKSLVIVSAGFKETGEAGEKLEKNITKKVKKANIRLLGPNCLGFLNNKENINLSFVRRNPGMGNAAFISQSGAFCTAVLDMALKRGLGFSHIFSLGNKADIQENELLDTLIKDKDVSTIVLYLEQFFDGKEFINIARNTKKPIITIVPGGTQKAQEAISSHTGSLVSSYSTTIATLKKANNIKVETTKELFNTLLAAELYKDKTVGKNLAIVTNAGGPGIIATTSAEKMDLNIVDLSDNTKRQLKESLSKSSSVNNPVDILGDALAEDYEKAIEIVLKDSNVDTVLVLLTPQLVTEISLTAEKISKLSQTSKKAIFTCFLGANDIEAGVGILEKMGVVNFESIGEAAETIFKISDFRENTTREKIPTIKSIKKDRENSELVGKFLGDNIVILPDKVTFKLLDEFDIPYAGCLVTANMQEAVEFSSKRFPVVLKANSSDLAHKTDFEGIYLDIRNITELEEKFTELRDTVTRVTGNLSPDLLVQEMLDYEAEVFIGANREGDIDLYEDGGLGFGHILAFGHGGIYTEVYKDISHIMIPECKSRIEEMMKDTKIWSILEGYRGKDPLAKEKLVELMEKIQRLLITYPEIISMDINPILLDKEKAIPVDTKIYIKN